MSDWYSYSFTLKCVWTWLDMHPSYVYFIIISSSYFLWFYFSFYSSQSSFDSNTSKVCLDAFALPNQYAYAISKFERLTYSTTTCGDIGAHEHLHRRSIVDHTTKQYFTQSFGLLAQTRHRHVAVVCGTCVFAYIRCIHEKRDKWIHTHTHTQNQRRKMETEKHTSVLLLSVRTVQRVNKRKPFAIDETYSQSKTCVESVMIVIRFNDCLPVNWVFEFVVRTVHTRKRQGRKTKSTIHLIVWKKKSQIKTFNLKAFEIRLFCLCAFKLCDLRNWCAKN